MNPATTDARPPLVLVVLGTRPEAVKLLPVVQALKAEPRLRVVLASTGQHREMVEQILAPFGALPDHDLEIMRPGQSLNGIVERAIGRLDRLLGELRPDWVVVQGDTTSAFCAALAAFHRQIAVAHVEAGLRSGDRRQPFPEEVNRRLVGVVADLPLAPTQGAADNLLAEGVDRERVHVTGNTTVDTLLAVLGLSGADSASTPAGAPPAAPRGPDGRAGRVLVTLHRRESWLQAGGRSGRTPLEELLTALADVAANHSEVEFLYPVHRNPAVWEPAHRILAGVRNVTLSEPLPYLSFVRAMADARVILSDSGGVQEEAPSLGVPVLVLRQVTERPEAIDSGHNVLVGTDPQALREHLERHLGGPPASRGPRPCPNPYGDGRAAFRVRDALLYHSGLGPRPKGFVPPPG